MELSHTIKKAHSITRSLHAMPGNTLDTICQDIKAAQQALNTAAEPYFSACTQRCKGMCCKTINVSEIITLLDMIFILTAADALYETILARAQNETLFPADCVFLQNGVGPCLFPADVKPERCIVTFCDDVGPIKKEIRAVRSAFSRLSRYTRLKRPFLWIGF